MTTCLGLVPLKMRLQELTHSLFACQSELLQFGSKMSPKNLIMQTKGEVGKVVVSEPTGTSVPLCHPNCSGGEHHVGIPQVQWGQSPVPSVDASANK